MLKITSEQAKHLFQVALEPERAENMSKHTPGRWIPVKCHNKTEWSHFISFDGQGICAVIGLKDKAQQDANARLIAAAPAMLEALEYIVKWNSGTWSPEMARNMANKAIAAAKGEKSCVK